MNNLGRYPKIFRAAGGREEEGGVCIIMPLGASPGGPILATCIHRRSKTLSFDLSPVSLNVQKYSSALPVCEKKTLNRMEYHFD